MLCMCFIFPSTMEEALQTATFTLVLAMLLNELEHLAIHTWKHTTHRGGEKKQILNEMWEIASVHRGGFLSLPFRAK